VSSTGSQGAGFAATTAPALAGGTTTTVIGTMGRSFTAVDTEILVNAAGSLTARVTPPHPPAGGNSVAAHGQHVVVVSMSPDGSTLTVSESANGGKTWHDLPSQAVGQPARDAAVALSPDGTHYIVGTDGKYSAGAGVPGGTAFLAGPDGKLTKIDIPGAPSTLAWAGNTLLVPGGRSTAHLYASANTGQTFTDVTTAVTGETPPSADVPLDTPALGGVIGLPDGTAFIPVATISDSGFTLAVKATTDGTTFTDVGTTVVAGSFGGGGGLSLADSAYGSDRAAFVPLGTTDLFIVSLSGPPQTVHMTGLPASPDAIAFQDATSGVAQVTVSGCNDGKDNCYQNTTNFITSDGGATWTPDPATTTN
jgi:hypothetical protein